MFYAAIGLLALVVLLLVIIVLRPTDFRVTRSAVMVVPPEKVFAQVNDFHKWEEWSPWAKLDLNCKNTYEGAAVGKDAEMHWSGNKKVGEGRMTIVESNPPGSISIRLEFLRPFACTNTAEFLFKPSGPGTEVTWSMYGKNTFMGKALGVFVNMDTMIGRDFAKGLAQLKTIVEARSA